MAQHLHTIYMHLLSYSLGSFDLHTAEDDLELVIYARFIDELLHPVYVVLGIYHCVHAKQQVLYKLSYIPSCSVALIQVRAM